MKLPISAGKRLLIDICVAKKAFKKYEIENIPWCYLSTRFWDGMNKWNNMKALVELMTADNDETMADPNWNSLELAKWVEYKNRDI